MWGDDAFPLSTRRLRQKGMRSSNVASERVATKVATIKKKTYAKAYVK